MAKSDENVTIEGNFSTKKNNSKLRLYIPFFTYKNMDLYGVDINVDTKKINSNALISINEMVTKGLTIASSHQEELEKMQQVLF